MSIAAGRRSREWRLPRNERRARRCTSSIVRQLPLQIAPPLCAESLDTKRDTRQASLRLQPVRKQELANAGARVIKQKKARPDPFGTGFSSETHQRLVTFSACKPFGPLRTSNSTAWPSASVLYPSAWMAE